MPGRIGFGTASAREYSFVEGDWQQAADQRSAVFHLAGARFAGCLGTGQVDEDIFVVEEGRAQ
eukprot:11159080-Lingulodinium_polyedra.AAC.1